MAKDKPSFVAYIDWKETFDALPDDKAGQLIKHIFAYVNDDNPQTDDILINAVFANIKNTLKRDLRKYEKIREKRSKAGKASANKKQQVSTSVESVEQTSTNSTVSVNGSVSVSVNGTVNENVTVRKKELYERKADFKKEIYPLLSDSFDREEGKAFFEYWSEHGKNDRKMRFEKEKSFSLQRRVNTWMKRKKEFAQEKKKDGKLSIEEYREQFFQTQSQNLIG